MHSLEVAISLFPEDVIESKQWCFHKGANTYAEWARGWERAFSKNKPEEPVLIKWKATINFEMGEIRQSLVLGSDIDAITEPLHFDSSRLIQWTENDSLYIYDRVLDVLKRNNLLTTTQFEYLVSLLYPEWAKGYINDMAYLRGYPTFLLSRALQYLQEHQLLAQFKLTSAPTYTWGQNNETRSKRSEIEESFGWNKESHVLLMYECSKEAKPDKCFLTALPPRIYSWLCNNSAKYQEWLQS